MKVARPAGGRGDTIRRSAEIFLRQGGYQVVLAEDGFDALSKVNDHEPEAMPDIIAACSRGKL